MNKDLRTLIERYAAWLSEKTTLTQVNATWSKITTPYLDRHNDMIEFYVRREGDAFFLTDDGYTIHDLKMSACDLSTKRRGDLLRMTLNGFGVDQEGDALTIRASFDDFPLKKHNLIQAILAVNDLFYTAKPIVANLFIEDVGLWLDENKIRYVQRVKLSGSVDHVFDYVIPRSEHAPERILQTINRPTRDQVENLAFAWVDTREARNTEAVAYAMLNDVEGSVPSAVFSVLKKYEIKAALWSERSKIASALAA